MLNAAASWLLERPRAARVQVLAGLVAASALLLVAAALLRSDLVPLLGGLAGCLLFAAAALGHRTVLDGPQRERFDLPARIALPRRRLTVVLSALTWAAVMLVASRFLPTVAVGTANVLVVLTLVWMWRLTEAERIDAMLTGAVPLPASEPAAGPETQAAPNAVADHPGAHSDRRRPSHPGR